MWWGTSELVCCGQITVWVTVKSWYNDAMLKLDNSLLEELGLGTLPEEQKKAMLQHIYETLELRVGTQLANQMTDAQLEEFERFIDAGGDQNQAQALQWLESNLPNYKQVVNDVFEALKLEVKQMAPQIMASSAAQPAVAQPQDQNQQVYTQSHQQPYVTQYQQPQASAAQYQQQTQPQPQYQPPQQPLQAQDATQQSQWQQPQAVPTSAQPPMGTQTVQPFQPQQPPQQPQPMPPQWQPPAQPGQSQQPYPPSDSQSQQQPPMAA